MLSEGRTQNSVRSGLEGKSVILVLCSLEMGGAERQALSLGRYLLHEQGARVQVWGFCNPGRAVELCEEYGIPWRIVPVKIRWNSPMRLLQSALQLGRLLRKERPDILLPYLRPSISM